jgi:hypothetical protein
MTTERRRVLDLLADLSDAYPDMRLGQFLTWFASAARTPDVESIYEVEDGELVRVMEQHLAKKRAETIRVG